MRPTWRCRAITTAPVAAPVMMADRHNIGNTGQIAASAAPALATTTASPTGRRRP